MKGTSDSIGRVDLSLSLMHPGHDPDRSWITDPDHPKGVHPKLTSNIDLLNN